MLSYRHAFHAGNHADVLKHSILLLLLKHLKTKGKPFLVVDTHAGAGFYSLESTYSKQISEFNSGISKLWARNDLPSALADYVNLVRTLNPDGKLKNYPGSPWCALQALREQDQLRLFELHSSDERLLRKNFAQAGRRVQIQHSDGLAGLKALLPPPSRRALTLIDPSYEDKQDYRLVVQVLREALGRFATGMYAIWYPCLPRSEARELPQKLKQLPAHSWLQAELVVRSQTPDEEGRIGMFGSGMIILNPPWTLQAELQELMPWLTEVLAQDEGATFLLEYEERK